MKKNIMITLLAFLLIAALAVPTQTAGADDPPRPLDRYPVTLYIGNMFFQGTLRRLDAISEDDYKKAVEAAMKDLKTSPLQIKEAQELVEKVARDDMLTPEEIRETWMNILSLMPAGDLIEALTGLPLDEGDVATVIQIMTNSEGKSSTDVSNEVMDAIVEKAGSEAWDTFLERMIAEILAESVEDLGREAAEAAAGQAVGFAGKAIDALTITADAYQHDQEKWRARAEAQGARELLRRYYETLREKIDQYRGYGKGWELTIDDSYRRTFSWFGIPGNSDRWDVLMVMRLAPPDPTEPIGPSGNYSGYISINVHYDVTPFDDGFLDMYRARYATYYTKIMQDSHTTIVQTESKSKQATMVTRQILNCPESDVELPLSVPAMPGSTTTFLDLSRLVDARGISIDHRVHNTVVELQYTWTASYTHAINPTQSSPCASTPWVPPDWGLSGSLSCSNPWCQSWGLALDWDDAIWNIWDAPKKLVIEYPPTAVRKP